MTTRKTTTGYKVTIDLDQWQEKFDFYKDVKVCFKPVSRDYRLDKITENFELSDVEIDYLLDKAGKDELEDYTEEHIKELYDYKNNYLVVGLSFGEHSQFAIGYGDDGVLLVDKDASNGFVKEIVKELESWFNGWIYRVNVFEPEKFRSEKNESSEVIYWNYVDGCGGYFSSEEALNGLPDYAGEIIKDTESERFEEFERC